jgi:hypothetical protein
MVRARVKQGRIELCDAMPAAWDGQMVELIPLGPEAPIDDLEERLAALHNLGAMEFEPGERRRITRALNEMDQLSKKAMHRLVDRMK